MNTKNETASPALKLEITSENYERAIIAKSSACLVADDIKQKYPQFSNVEVDVATVRFTDRKRGVRYTYLTPPAVAEMLLFFDQGWREENLPKKLLIRRAVRITPIVRSKSNLRIKNAQKAERLAELEAKVQSGQPFTSGEKRALTKLQQRKEPPARPTTYGKTETQIVGNDVVQHGGMPPKYPKRAANLLDGRTRHFGAKVAKPNEVFEKAVKEAVKADRAKQKRSKPE